MQTNLFPCPSCGRHVRRSEPACPFCGARTVEAALVAPVRRHPAQRLGRAASFAFGAALSAGCSTPAPTPSGDAGPDDAPILGDAVPIYGGPDAPIEDTGTPTADTGSIDGGSAALDSGTSADVGIDVGGGATLYGAPPGT